MNRENDKNIKDIIESILGEMSSAVNDLKDMEEKIKNDTLLSATLAAELQTTSKRDIEAAKIIMTPIVYSVCKYIKTLPNIADMTKESSEVGYYVLKDKLVDIINVGLALAISYSQETIKEKTIPTSESSKEASKVKEVNFDSPEEFLDHCLKEGKDTVESFLEEQSIPREAVIPLGIKIDKNRATGEIKDAAVYNVFTSEEVDWNDLEDSVKEATIEVLKEKDEDGEKIIECLNRKGKKSLEVDNKMSMEEEEETNKSDATLDEFLDFFSSMFNNIGGER